MEGESANHDHDQITARNFSVFFFSAYFTLEWQIRFDFLH